MGAIGALCHSPLPISTVTVILASGCKVRSIRGQKGKISYKTFDSGAVTFSSQTPSDLFCFCVLASSTGAHPGFYQRGSRIIFSYFWPAMLHPRASHYRQKESKHALQSCESCNLTQGTLKIYCFLGLKAPTGGPGPSPPLPWVRPCSSRNAKKSLTNDITVRTQLASSYIWGYQKIVDFIF